MDKEHLKGVASQVTGKAKEFIGHATGDTKLVAEGKFDQAKGAAHNVLGDAKDAGRNVVDSLRKVTSSGK
jgi:uncharacterized protein YjbJ (UPF0337 family)